MKTYDEIETAINNYLGSEEMKRIIIENADYENSSTYGITIEFYIDLDSGKIFHRIDYPNQFPNFGNSKVIGFYSYDVFTEYSIEDILSENEYEIKYNENYDTLLETYAYEDIEEYRNSGVITYYDIDDITVWVEKFLKASYEDRKKNVIEWFMNEENFVLDNWQWEEISLYYDNFAETE